MAVAGVVAVVVVVVKVVVVVLLVVTASAVVVIVFYLSLTHGNKITIQFVLPKKNVIKR